MSQGLLLVAEDELTAVRTTTDRRHHVILVISVCSITVCSYLIYIIREKIKIKHKIITYRLLPPHGLSQQTR